MTASSAQKTRKSQQEQSLRNVTHRELALADPFYLMGYYMEQRCLPHRETFLDFFLETPTHKILLAPREHWKTTTLVGYLVWRILNNPDIRILVVAHNMDFARDSVKTIRDYLQTPLIIRDFGNLASSHWGKEAFTVRRKQRLHEPTCMSAGIGTGILGRHFDIVWCDDIIKTETQWTEEQREKVSGWFRGTLLRCCDHEMLITGTRKHTEDLYQELMKQDAYRVEVFRAVINEETREILAPGLKEPAMDTFEWLQLERRKMGELWFSQEMQNEPVAMEGLALKREWIQYYDPNDPPKFRYYYLGIDPAIGKTDVSSYTACILIGVTDYLHYYVIDIQRHHWPIGWTQKVISLWKHYCDEGRRPNLVGVEAIMTGLMQARELAEAASAMPLKFVDYRVRKEDGFEGVLPRDKIGRIQSLGAYFELGRIFLPDPDHYPMTITFEKEEYLVFPEGERTDMLDALNIAILLAPLTREGITFR